MKASTPEALFMLNASVGQTMFSQKKDKDITAAAVYYGRKVKTERMIVLSGTFENPIVEPITKVTLCG